MSPDASGSTAHPIRAYFVGLGITILLLIGAVVTYAAIRHTSTTLASDRLQQQLAPFYVPPPGWQAQPPGTLLRSEPLGGIPAGGVGWRILYVTAAADGTKRVSSGMVFAPGRSGPAAPPEGRKVIAWAHPTVGMGVACAPSRTSKVTSDVPGLSSFLAAGWVVAATDYAGLGTAGTEQYLIGAAEGHDVLYSVLAARHIADAHAGTTVGIFGHSQGGHAALFAASMASTVPELHVVGTVSAAPAAELAPLISHQWNTIYGSLIGSEVLISYPATYPGLHLSSVTSSSSDQVATLANKCVLPAALDIVVSKALGGSPLLSRDPLGLAAWGAALRANTPPVPAVPTLLVQGTADPIVLPGSNALYIGRACAAASPITGDFIGTLGHMKAGFAAAPGAFTFFQLIFQGRSPTSTCGTKTPVAPLRTPRG